MAGIIRFFFGLILSAFAARVVDGLMSPRSKTPIDPGRRSVDPALDLKPCPTCGVYTTQPCQHCTENKNI